MNADELRDSYVLYIGAGAVAAGGIISLFRALPLIVGSLAVGLRDLRWAQGRASQPLRRTERDLSMSFVVFGSLALVVVIWAFLPLGLALELGGPGWAPSWSSLFGFLFVTVSSRLTGEIGSSSNPISGMTVATLILTCLIFLVLGLDGHGGPADRHDRGGRRVRRLVQRRHHVAGPEDRLPRRRHAQVSAVGHRRRRGHLGPGHRRHPPGHERRQHDLSQDRDLPSPPTPSTSAC